MVKLKIKHPSSGHVIFTNPTARQIEVLEAYSSLQKVLEVVKSTPNNEKLGALIRESIN